MTLINKISEINTDFDRAQKELDNRISDYYRRNEDGGNWEERYVIACRIGNKYGLDHVEQEKLNF